MFQNRNKYFRRLFMVRFQSTPGFMALMRPVANCDCNHNYEHGRFDVDITPSHQTYKVFAPEDKVFRYFQTLSTSGVCGQLTRSNESGPGRWASMLNNQCPLSLHKRQWSIGCKQDGLSREHPPQRDFTNPWPHHQTADRVWVYSDEPGPD